MLSDVGKSLTSTLKNLFIKPITDTTIEDTIKSVCTTLINSNVSPKLVLMFRASLREKLKIIPPGISKPKHISQTITDSLVGLLDTETKPYVIEKKRPNIVVFLGLQGSGKTTTVCKYANYYNKKGFKTGIVCADTFRAGAFDQVKQNALKIKVPFFGSKNNDPVQVAREGVERFVKEKFELILVDTSGRNTQEKEFFKEMREIMDAVKPNNIVFVMDAGIGQSAETQARGFSGEVSVGSIILTKTDGSAKAGGALSSVAVTKCPIEFIGTGEGMEDFDCFDERRFVNKLLGKGDMEGLFDKVSNIKIDEKEMLKKIEKGNFHLRDFYDQFQQLMSLGPLNKILEMMPGMGNVNLPDNDSLKKMIYIFDSLSKKELDSDGSLFNDTSRVIRVARGSGTTPRMVMDLLLQFKQISSMMKKLGKMPGFSDMVGKDPSGMTLTEKTRMKGQMKGMLPKELFDQMSKMFE